MTEAFENCALAMFNYMTPLKGIGADPALTRQAGAPLAGLLVPQP